MKLPAIPTQEQILANINSFKITALNLATEIVTNENSQHLEPKEIKTLSDMVLNIEDSLRNQDDSEGEQARTINRLLEKYATEDYNLDSLTTVDLNTRGYSHTPASLTINHSEKA